MTNPTRVLITGGTGDLGTALIKRYELAGWEVLAPSHRGLDVCEHDMVFDYIMEFNPALVIHTAARIDARWCEEYWREAQAVNITGTYNVAQAAFAVGAKLVHVSSTCVFDGETGPFNEDSKPAPKNWYALTKFAAEHVVASMPAQSLIVRTNFVARKPWKYPKAFTDRFGTYLFADDVAFAIKKLSHMTGIVHICGDRKMSMFELAKMVSPNVQSMTLQEYDGPPVSRDMSLESSIIPPFRIGCGTWSE